jgi:hypothetical protein
MACRNLLRTSTLEGWQWMFRGLLISSQNTFPSTFSLVYESTLHNFTGICYSHATTILLYTNQHNTWFSKFLFGWNLYVVTDISRTTVIVDFQFNTDDDSCRRKADSSVNIKACNCSNWGIMDQTENGNSGISIAANATILIRIKHSS